MDKHEKTHHQKPEENETIKQKVRMNLITIHFCFWFI